MMNITDCAAALAKRLHAGQVDKAGVDYFEGHLSTVASYCDELLCKCCAYLHDAAEDTPHTEEEVVKLLEEEIASHGLAPLTPQQAQNIVETLKKLNHHCYSTREEYIAGLRGNVRAMRVKMADLKHNMDLSRLPNPTEKDFTRLKRYQKEYELINSWYCEATQAAE